MASSLAIRLENTVSATPDQVSSALSDEVVILDLKGGVYHGLNPTGSRVWELLQQPRTVAEIRDTLLKEYDVEPGRCERDLFSLLERLADKGLVEVRPTPVG